MALDEKLWQRCADFHGHVCGGLAIGYQAARYAAALMGADFSRDEELVCVAENDACGIDAIQVLLGCSVGKGNLLFHMRGKQAFSFYDRRGGKSFRLVFNDLPEGTAGTMEYVLSHAPEELFTVKEARPMPQPAKLFRSYHCACCGEKTGEKWIRLVDGEYRCLDCMEEYDRFHV
ncbi:MAG: formylmethanofuran dehydrogenase [Firmicutes bacterium]|nr:formylmethanofuran dehydrogenase [Bacillota bacterium]